MSLLKKIKADQIEARKSARGVDDENLHGMIEHKSRFLTTLLAEASAPGFNDGKRESTDAEVIQVCKKFIKNLNELLTHDPHNQNATDELIYINKYMPDQMTVLDMERRVLDYLREYPESNMGAVMSYFKQNFDGQYDARELSKIVKAHV